jgi:hypothetical protein
MHVEALERRRMWSGVAGVSAPMPAAAAADAPAATVDTSPPRVIAQRLIGAPREVTGIALTFDEPLDPVRAADPANYRASREWFKFPNPWQTDRASYSFNVLDELPVTAATYDDATRTVTLSLSASTFLLARKNGTHFRVIMKGGPEGLRDVAGNALPQLTHDGVRARISAHLSRFKMVYRDADRDRVTLRLRGPGRLFLVYADQRLELTIVDGDPRRTILTGKVIRSKPGDGSTIIHSVNGITPARVAHLADQRIQVLSSTE